MLAWLARVKRIRCIFLYNMQDFSCIKPKDVVYFGGAAVVAALNALTEAIEWTFYRGRRLQPVASNYGL